MPPTKKTNWTFGGKDITLLSHMPKDAYGFVYQIEIELNGNKLYYIGRKQLISRRKKMMNKKEVAALANKRLKKYYYVEKESDWQNYMGSNKPLLALINQYGVEKLNLKKEILEYCFSELELKYKEVKNIICSGSMESTEYFNDNISIKQIGTFNFNKQ